MSENLEFEMLIKNSVKCKLGIHRSNCIMANTCVMKMIEFYEGEDVAVKCPNCGHVMDFIDDYWECPNCLHRITAHSI